MEVHLLTLADGRLHSITGTGQFTLQRLRLNRPALVAYRVRKRSQDEQVRLLQQFQDLLVSLKQLHDRLAEAVEEQHVLLRRQRAVLTHLPEESGPENGSGPSSG